jgi:hypothetical protein
MSDRPANRPPAHVADGGVVAPLRGSRPPAHVQPERSTTFKEVIAHVPDRPRSMTQLQLPIVEGVACRVEQLLQRVQGVKRGTTITRPTGFNARGQAHANRIAQQDQVPESGTSTRNHNDRL